MGSGATSNDSHGGGFHHVSGGLAARVRPQRRRDDICGIADAEAARPSSAEGHVGAHYFAGGHLRAPERGALQSDRAHLRTAAAAILSKTIFSTSELPLTFSYHAS